MLLELPPIPAPLMTASQDAKRSTSKLRLPSDWLRTGIRPARRHDVVFRVNTAPYRFSTNRSSRLDL